MSYEEEEILEDDDEPLDFSGNPTEFSLADPDLASQIQEEEELDNFLADLEEEEILENDDEPLDFSGNPTFSDSDIVEEFDDF